MLPLKIIITLKKFVHPNIMTLMKWVTLTYPTLTYPSLNKKFDVLQHLLSCTKTNFDIIAISETRITRQVSLLNFNNYY